MNRLKRAEETDENRAFSNRKAGLLDVGGWDDKGRKVHRRLRKNREDLHKEVYREGQSNLAYEG